MLKAWSQPADAALCFFGRAPGGLSRPSSAQKSMTKLCAVLSSEAVVCCQRGVTAWVAAGPSGWRINLNAAAAAGLLHSVR